jgi:hypothetical protein
VTQRAGEYLYWASGLEGESIARASADGIGYNPRFITGGINARSVAVDDHYVFWANETSNQVTAIGRAKRDSSAPNLGFITLTDRPTGVAVDGDHIYWARDVYEVGGAIGRANVDGTGINQALINTPYAPSGVAVDANHIYWTLIGMGTGGPGSIGRAELNGDHVDQNFIGGLGRPYGIAVVSPLTSTGQAAMASAGRTSTAPGSTRASSRTARISGRPGASP